MSQHRVEFADTDSARGIRYVTIMRYADQRGCHAGERINVTMADFMGYRPPVEDDDDWERAIRQAGIPKIQPQLIKNLQEFFSRLDESDSEI